MSDELICGMVEIGKSRKISILEMWESEALAGTVLDVDHLGQVTDTHGHVWMAHNLMSNPVR